MKKFALQLFLKDAKKRTRIPFALLWIEILLGASFKSMLDEKR